MNKPMRFILMLIVVLIHFRAVAAGEDIVDRWGQLRVEDAQIVNEAGTPVALRGMSLFWSQWIGKYYNAQCVEWLKEDWKCTVVRAAMAVDADGYLVHPETEMRKVVEVIEACIGQGIYVIVDWHDHEAEKHVEAAIEFFREIAQSYGDEPNLIYEIYNEPLQISWPNVVKPYADTLVAEIRSIDPDNIIIVGTPTWSQDVDVAARNPVLADNIAYAVHFYSGTHTQWLRNKSTNAMNNGAALFASEWGTTQSNGDGPLYLDETDKWIDYMDEHLISWCNWSIADKNESSAALKPGASAAGGWTEDDLTESGIYVREQIIAFNEKIGTPVETDHFADQPGSFTIRHYPNPFNNLTWFELSIASARHVSLALFNLQGQRVKTLIDDYLSPGVHRIPVQPAGLPSGSYVYRCRTSYEIRTGSIQLVK
ncbi:cellulase family glycosylhydrolase [bacterium]|nr:cellulase family glycosylhydrolase [bacterium]